MQKKCSGKTPLPMCKSSFPWIRLSRVRRRVIREILHGIGFLHASCFVLLLYHTDIAIDEESLNTVIIFYNKNPVPGKMGPDKITWNKGL